jgi:hypothetical protein
VLISDPTARAARAEEKRQLVLKYLCEEVWTSQQILQLVAGIGTRQATNRLLLALEKEGLVSRELAPTVAGRQGAERTHHGAPDRDGREGSKTARGPGVLHLWGITPQGRALTAEADPTGPVFEPGRISIVAVPHQIMLQEVRYRAELAGWSDWIRGEQIGTDRFPLADHLMMTTKGPGGRPITKPRIKPDAVALSHQGVRVAVEVERTIKHKQDYQTVLARHLEAIRTDAWKGVYYIAPTPAIAAGLDRMLKALGVLVGGETFDDQKRSRFKIFSMAEFPAGVAQGAP